MFKKIISTAIILAIILSIVPVTSVTASERWRDGDFYFQFESAGSNRVVLVNYIGSSANVQIPRRTEYDGVFRYVYTIGVDAFRGLDFNLNNVTFESGSRVQRIRASAFRDSNVRSITFPSTIRYIDERAFERTRLETVTFPGPINLDFHAFRDNADLRTVHFQHTDGNDVRLDDRVFDGARSGFRITRPSGATGFGSNWHHRYTAHIATDTHYSDWRFTILTGNNIAITGFEPDSPIATLERVEIPARIDGRVVRNIQRWAFEDHRYMESVVIPYTVQNIEQDAFNSNRWLRDVYLRHEDANDITIHPNAFRDSHHNFRIFFPYGARGFTTPTWNGFPAQATGLDGIWEFSPLGGGTDLMITGYSGGASVVEIPASIEGRPVRYIGSETFSNNNTITEIVFPASIVHIQANAVMSVPNLRVARLRHMNADTLDLSGWAFSGVHNEFTIIFPADAVGFTTPLFVGFPAEADWLAANWVYEVLGGNAIIEQYLGNEAHVEIPNYIGTSPVRTIATGAFTNNSAVQRVTIPASVNRIEANAFHNMPNLYAAELLHTNANQLNNFSEYSFVGVAPHFRIIFPRGATGFTTPTWNGYFTESDSDDMTIREGNFEYIIRREAAPGMQGATRDVVVITRYVGTTQNVEIPSTLGGFPVVGIGDFAFLQNHNVTNVTIPSSVTSIGHSAFLSASSLETANFLHSSTTGLDLHANTFRYTADNFTILYPLTAVGFSTPTWQGWPARPYTSTPGTGTPTVPGIPGFPGTPTDPSGLNNPFILTSRTLSANDPHLTRDGVLLHAPIFRLEPFAPDPNFSTSYVMTRVIADILGLEISFNEITRTGTFSGYNAQNQHIVMEITIDSTQMRVNGVPREVRASAGVVPAVIRNDRFFVPVLVFQEVFGVTIQWNGATQSVTINP